MLKALNAEQEKDVERVREREELIAKADTMRKKLPWLKYDMKKSVYVEAEEKEKALKKKLDDAARILNNLQEPIELKEMENASSKLLIALQRTGAQKIFEAYNWLKEHQHEFKEVYGPVLLEVNVSNCCHADYLEDHVPYYIWKSFITQDSRDRDLLVRNLRPFDVPVLNYVGNEGQQEPFHISEELLG